jgi:hypothetical protein
VQLPFGQLAFVGRMQIEELATGLGHVADFGDALLAKTVMHQNLHASGSAAGEQISAVRFHRTEHCDHPGKRSFSAGTYVHGVGGEPDGIDAEN